MAAQDAQLDFLIEYTAEQATIRVQTKKAQLWVSGVLLDELVREGFQVSEVSTDPEYVQQVVVPDA